MVRIELLVGSSSKTRVPFTGSRQDQLVIDLINPSKCLIYLQDHSIDPGGSLPPLRWGFRETFRLGLEHDPGCLWRSCAHVLAACGPIPYFPSLW
jgi:hypothetical protein